MKKKIKLRAVKDETVVYLTDRFKTKWTVIKKEKGKALLNSMDSGISKWYPLSREVWQ